MEGSFLAADGYLPLGGLQIIGSLVGLFSKNKFVKFHALQSLVYWVLSVVLLFILLWILSITIGLDGPVGLLIFGYAIAAYLILPIVLGVKAYRGKTFYLPLVGRWIAKLVHYEQEVSQIIQPIQ
jgi:uncharacterized membrane protein